MAGQISRIVLDESAIRELLEGTNGPIAKDLTRRAIKVEGQAKRLCPVDTGRLRASITHDVDKDDQGIYAMVGTDVHYGPYIELGTRFMRPQPYLRPALRAAT